jgi:MSHA biogenesis protein MshO
VARNRAAPAGRANAHAGPIRTQRGFTLNELIITMVVVAIVAALGAQFVKPAVDSYVDTLRRAELTDFADLLARRMERELRSALPNSIRLSATATGFALEFVPTRGGGLYRALPTAAGGGDVLRFDIADTAFDALGPVPIHAAGDYLVIANLGEGSGADFYGAGTLSRSTLTSSNTSATAYSTDSAPVSIAFASFRFPVPSPASRFHIATTPVSYVCDTTARTLARHSGYGVVSAQPVPPTGATRTDLLAGNLSACTMRYSPGVTSRVGLVSMEMKITDARGESVDLVMQAHVTNEP